jgi:ABC-type enterochelin transport system permease subunit
MQLMVVIVVRLKFLGILARRMRDVVISRVPRVAAIHLCRRLMTITYLVMTKSSEKHFARCQQHEENSNTRRGGISVH